MTARSWQARAPYGGASGGQPVVCSGKDQDAVAEALADHLGLDSKDDLLLRKPEKPRVSPTLKVAIFRGLMAIYSGCYPADVVDLESAATSTARHAMFKDCPGLILPLFAAKSPSDRAAIYRSWRATPRTKRNENNTRRTYKILAKTARSLSGKRWPPHLSDNIGRNNQFHGTLSACPRIANTSSILKQVVGWKRGRRERGP